MTLAKFLLVSPLHRNLPVISPNLVELLNSQANGLSQRTAKETEGVFMRKFIFSSLVLCLLALTALGSDIQHRKYCWNSLGTGRRYPRRDCYYH